MMDTPGIYTRRRVLLAAAAGVIAVGAGSRPLWKRYARTRASWIEASVRANLPGVRLEVDSLHVFVRHMLARNVLAPHTHRMAAFVQQLAPSLLAEQARVHDALARRERQILTEYLIGSNFFRVTDPLHELIVYYGPPVACSNPFASFV